MDEYDIIEFVTIEDELVEKNYIYLFRIHKVSRISYHLCKKYDTF